MWERCKTIINSVAVEVLGIMELANKGMWFDDECQAATEDKKTKHIGRCNKDMVPEE